MPQKFARKIAAVALASAASLTLGACASIPGANVAPGSPITAEEAQVGAQYHEQFVAEFGGEMTGPYARYVQQIGANIALQSGLANSREAFDVTLLNSSVNNAFAVPGGYIYATRQLVNLMNSEAELAAVLGHEVGHVAARHSARRQQRAQRNQLLGILGTIIGGAVLNSPELARLSQTGAQALTLSYSRSQELEADQLGIEYLNRAGYDPNAMSTLLASLAAQNQLDAQLQGRDNATIPEWASTHPDPASRVRNAQQLAAGGSGILNRDTFLQRIDGMIYGDDPEQGVIEGRQFIHPILRFTFTAPQGTYMVNGTRAVSINGDTGRAQLTVGPYSGDLGAYIGGVFNALSGDQQQIRPSSIERTTVNGLPAAYGTARVNNGQQQVDVTVFAYEFGSTTAYHFMAVTPAGQAGNFNSLYQSMRRISASEAGSVTPRRVDVVTAGRGDSVATLSRRMAYDTGSEARFRVLNGMGSGDQVIPGRQYKIVIRSN